MPEIVHATRAARTQPASALDDARAVSGTLSLDAGGMDTLRRTIDTALKPSRDQAEAAVRTLLLWAGEDPARQGLLDTPKRVVRSYEEHFRGYSEDPIQLLQRTFDETDGYDEMVVLKNMRFESHCEHHLAPIIGHASIAYLPSQRVIGISKLARLLDVFSKRLTLQEKMTAQIANALEQAICPRGVAVVVDAVHHCMTTRGVHKTGVSMVTSRMLGVFRDNATTRQELLSFLNNSSSGPNHR